VAIIGVSIVVQVLGQVQDSQTLNSAEYNVTEAGITGMATFSDWWSVIVTVIIAVIVIGLVLLLAKPTN
jgi:type II secretory pathway component PulF